MLFQLLENTNTNEQINFRPCSNVSCEQLGKVFFIECINTITKDYNRVIKATLQECYTIQALLLSQGAKVRY